MNYFLKKLTKKLLIRRIKKTFHIKHKTFVKPKNFTSYQLIASKKHCTQTKSSQLRSITVGIENVLNILYKRKLINATLSYKNTIVFNKYNNKQLLSKYTAINYKNFIVKKLFSCNEKQNNPFNTINNNYITNLSLLTTNFFRVTKNNFYLYNSIQSLKQCNKTNGTVWNYITSNSRPKCDVTNYTPITAFITPCTNTSHTRTKQQTNTASLYLQNFDKNVCKYFFIHYVISFLEKYVHKKL